MRGTEGSDPTVREAGDQEMRRWSVRTAFSRPVNNLRRSRRFCGCRSLKGAYPHPSETSETGHLFSSSHLRLTVMPVQSWLRPEPGTGIQRHSSWTPGFVSLARNDDELQLCPSASGGLPGTARGSLWGVDLTSGMRRRIVRRLLDRISAPSGQKGALGL